MASITVLKHKQDNDFKNKFLDWVRDNKIRSLELTDKEKLALLNILSQFASEIEIVKAIQESSDFITNNGLHHLAAKLLEEFIKKNTDYIILDNIEVLNDDHALIVLTE